MLFRSDKSQISAPLMSRFAVIDIPDYTPEEKKTIFSRFSLPKVLKRMGMSEQECIVTPEGLDVVVRKYENTTGIRDLEQANRLLAAADRERDGIQLGYFLRRN